MTLIHLSKTAHSGYFMDQWKILLTSGKQVVNSKAGGRNHLLC